MPWQLHLAVKQGQTTAVFEQPRTFHISIKKIEQIFSCFKIRQPLFKFLLTFVDI